MAGSNANLLDALAPFMRGQQLRAADLNTIVDALRVALNVTGPDVKVGPGGVYIRRQPMSSNKGWFWGLINAHQQLNSGAVAVRWNYGFYEIAFDPSTGIWSPEAGGRNSGSADGFSFANPLLNLTETYNQPPNGIAGDAMGYVGPGVDMDGPDYPAGFTIKPLDTGFSLPIPIFIEPGDPERYFCSMANAHDGTCTA